MTEVVTDDKGGGNGADAAAVAAAAAAAAAAADKGGGNGGDSPAFDWRREIAGEDEKLYGELGRTTDLKSLHKRLVDTQSALRDSGRVKLLGKDATDEDRKAFATALKIPEKSDGYKIDEKEYLPDGMKLGDADKAFLKTMTDEMHKAGGFLASPETVGFAHRFYAAQLEEAQARMIAAADTQKTTSLATLKKEWGPDFKRNTEIADAGFAQLAKAAGADIDTLKGLQFTDGTRLLDAPWFSKMMAFAGTQLQADPTFWAAQNNTSAPADVDKRIQEIRGWRSGTPAQRKQYAEASAPGGEYHVLLARKEQLSSVKAA